MSEIESKDRPRRGIGRYMLAVIPLAIFAVFAGTAGKMLYDQEVNGKNVSDLPSALIGTKAPTLAMAGLDGSDTQALTSEAIAGKLTLVNVFASWCAPCRLEHPQLLELQRQGVAVVGIAYKDDPVATRAFLDDLGDPFAMVLVDREGRAGLDLGISGVPETFAVDAMGKITAKASGPLIQPADIEPLIAALNAPPRPLPTAAAR